MLNSTIFWPLIHTIHAHANNVYTYQCQKMCIIKMTLNYSITIHGATNRSLSSKVTFKTIIFYCLAS